MNNLRTSIDILFRKIPAELLFSSMVDEGKDLLCESVWRKPLVKNLLLNELTGYSTNDVENVLRRLEEDWGTDNENVHDGRNVRSVFSLLQAFTSQVLTVKGNEPIIDYQHLLRWRELSHVLGEDLFTCSYLATQDTICSHHRTFFAWRPILSTNNIRLKNLLDQGVAENHFHLQGSSPHNDLSWLALMNKVTKRKKQFELFLKDGKLSPNIGFRTNQSEEDLYLLVLKAAYIRLVLFQQINKLDGELFLNTEMGVGLFNSTRQGNLFFAQLHKLQASINSARYLYGREIDVSAPHYKPDYCLNKDLELDNLNGNEILCGERMLLYHCFRHIKIGDSEFRPFQDLFYAYLVIKSKFREEMVQVNKQVGFANFSTYQDRKTIFLGERDIYQRQIFRMAIQTSRANQNIQSFEARISPKNDVESNKRVISSIDKDVLQKRKSSVDRYLKKFDVKRSKKYPFFYVYHFIKSKERRVKKNETEDVLGSIQCRHYHLRKVVERQAKALAQLREGISSVNHRIAGIDAASSEFDARPEVFAQAFRYLKLYRNKGIYDRLKEFRLNEIKATFHAGEDFFDIVDGLRTIDEAIKFLNLSEGDRLGHCIALGVNPRDYYLTKLNTLMIPKQLHLDNVSWLISRIRKYNLHQFSTYANHLEWHFQTLFYEVFASYEDGKSDTKTRITTELYYEAWKLRGDNPYLYQVDGSFDQLNHITFWSKCGVNEKYPENGLLRKSEHVNQIYYHYHFNPEVKKKGSEIIEFKILPEYINLVVEIQRCFQKELAKKHMGIETNPTSNCLIGTFRRYDKHPILQFFNLGLETDPDKIKNCPQLFVSINTDDQGVFNTYLENEYALMALALEKMKDENGRPIYHSAMIYDWLDRIRRMGLEMSFKKGG